MDDTLSIEELSRWTGQPPERLREWRSLGIIGGAADERFAPEDKERVHLIVLSLERGIGIETIAEVARRTGGLIWAPYADVSRTGMQRLSRAEAAAQLGIDEGLLRRLWQTGGFVEDGDMFDEEDIGMLRGLKVALDAGFPEDAVLQIVRVYADAFGRVADAESRLFRFYVQGPMRASDMEEVDFNRASQEASLRLYELVEPTILYFHRRSLLRAVREDTVSNLAEAAGLLEADDVPGRMRVAIVFIDISSFTPLAEAMGDVPATRILSDFSNLVREAAALRQGRVIKQMGDAFMLTFQDPQSALLCALDMEQRAAATAQFPAVRSGVHWGSVLYREGDYFGSTVNITSRVAAEAGRHQVLVTGAVRREIQALEHAEFVPLGKRRLKGVAEEVELFEARSTQRDAGKKAVDPVCGTELSASEVAASLSLEGEERAFCSQDCLRRFIAAPENYAGTAAKT